MSHIEEELASQPACWRTAPVIAAAHAAILPAKGERVAVVGCGTSLFMAQAYAALRESDGHGETDAFPASEFRFGRRYDRVVVITRSGTTTEILQFVPRLPAGTRSVAITAAGDAPVADLATATLPLDAAAERSVVQTRFPTTVLAVLRAALGERIDGAIADAERALADPLPVVPADHHQFTFLGTGWGAAVANEAALKCREAAGVWTESYPAMEYRHGPISASGPGTVVWVFGSVPERLAADIAATGATMVASALDPLADLVRAQRLAVALAHANGRDPDRPRALAFSVVLDEPR